MKAAMTRFASHFLCPLGLAAVLLAGRMVMLFAGLGFPMSTVHAAPQSTPTPTLPVPPHVCLACISPIPQTFPALYRLVQGRWTPTRIASLNEPLRFVVRVQSGIAGWSHLIVHVRIRRTFIGGHGVRGALPAHIYRVCMAATGQVGAYTRFAVQVSFHSRAMVGVLFAAFHVSNGTGYEEPGFIFRVLTGGR
jgi:hypothetical protein